MFLISNDEKWLNLKKSFWKELIELCKYTATQGFLLVPLSWYQRIEQREITEGYRGYMEFDIAFVSWVKVLLDLFKLCKFLSLDPVFPKKKIIYFWFKTMKNDWVWRKCFERYITILSVLVDIRGVLFFQLVSLLQKLDSKFESFFTE